MIKTALAALEISVNRYLALDPDTLTRLAELSDQVIFLEITDWRLQWILLPSEQGIKISEDLSLVPTASLRAKAWDLLKVGMARGSNEALFENKIEMSGDIEAAEKIRSILKNMDIDWEEHFSRITGDVFAHSTFQGLRKIRHTGKRIWTSLRQNVRDYLQVESSTLPTSKQMEKFFDDIGRLRNDVDRLEARLQHLAKRKKLS